MVNLLESLHMQTDQPIDDRMIVKTNSNRDAIEKAVRYIGMEVYVSDDKKKYRLEDGIENTHWKEIRAVAKASELIIDDDHMTVTKAEKEKWDNAASAVEHTHKATDITQDETHKFVSDTQISSWDSKADGNHNHDNVYASTVHTHTEYQAKGDYALSTHNHDEVYANKSHTHQASEITDMPELPEALKNPNTLTIQLNGASDVVYDGSVVKSVNITPDGIGAQVAGDYALATHNHEGVYQPKGEYAASTHKHSVSEITGLPTELKNPTSLSIQLNDGVVTSYDGSEAKSIKITSESIGSYNKKEVDTKIKEVDTKIENYKIKKYGVKFSGSNPVGIRTYDAVGMVANVGVDDQIVQNDFDKVSFYNRPVCCGHHDTNGNFIVHAYEGEPGFKRDGTNGEVYYECTPFYWNGLYEEPVVAADKFEGSILAPMFKTADEKVYLPCYWAATVGGKYVSRSGLYPTWSSVNGHMAACRNTNANAHIETIKAHMSEYVLQLVEFATKDLQTIMMGSCNHIWENPSYVTTLATTDKTYVVMAKDKASAYVVGQTIVTSSNWSSQRTITRIVDYDSANSAIYFDNQPVISCAKGAKVSIFSYKTGATDNVKASSGSNVSNTDGKHQCKWRGKEAPWADSFSGLCDILRVIEGGKHYPYYLPDPKKYNNGTLTSDYVKLGYEVSATGGYAKTLGVNEHYPFAAITNQIGADSVTYLSAYYWTSTNPTTVAFVGGSWYFGRFCSPVYFTLYSTPSHSDVDRLARLFVTPV